MLRKMSKSTWLAFVLLASFGRVSAGTYTPNADIGYPAGLIPDCPGTTKNASISPRMLQQLQIVMHRFNNSQIVRKPMPISTAYKILSKDNTLDFKQKRTVVYAIGYMDMSVLLQSQAVANAYVKRGYNVFVTETFAFLSYIYPKSVRLTKVIGMKLGEFLVKLDELGVSNKNLELLGLSLGAHVAAYAAKHYYKVTGKKPSRITGLDPAGPCFRNMDSEHRLSPTDAEKVDVIHTNIDGFGIAERLGHVDFYVNGGEYQPSDIPSIPCLVICSHFRSVIYWWQAIEHPKKFIGMQCNSIQDARFAKCFNSSVTNYAGLETNFKKPGIFYLPTHNEFPYYRGKEGLIEENEIFLSVLKDINAQDNFDV